MSEDAEPEKGDRVELVNAKGNPSWLDPGDRGTVTEVRYSTIRFNGGRTEPLMKLAVDWDVADGVQSYTLFSTEDDWKYIGESTNES